MKGAQSQTVSTMPDAATNAYVTGSGGSGGYNPQTLQTLQSMGLGDLANKYAQFGAQGGSGISGFGGLRNFAVNAAMQPLQISPFLTAGAQGLQNIAQQGATGLAAQTDPAAAAKFMNPYLSALDPAFNKLRAQSLNAANSNATSQGAYGGSRAAVTGGVALSNVNNLQNQTNYGAFNDAMSRALQSANLGLGANSLMGGLGQYLTNLPMQYRQQQLGLLLGGIGPYGQTQTVPTQSDPLSGALGIASMFIPGGPLAGLFGGGAGAGFASSAPALPV